VPSVDAATHRYKIVYSPDIALAMYRELASHLEQIEGVEAQLFWSESTEFSYLGSQIGGLWLTYGSSISLRSQSLITKILNHYGQWNADPKLPISS